MDREFVLFVLAALCVGLAVPVGAIVISAIPAGNDDGRPGRALERAAARRLLLPLSPALFAFFTLLGWALMEPEDAERVPWWAFLGMTPVLLVWLRAASRAVRALAPRQRSPPAGNEP